LKQRLGLQIGLYSSLKEEKDLVVEGARDLRRLTPFFAGSIYGKAIDAVECDELKETH